MRAPGKTSTADDCSCSGQNSGSMEPGIMVTADDAVGKGMSGGADKGMACDAGSSQSGHGR